MNYLVALFSMTLSSISFAGEEFTLTRGNDNKVFVCTEQGTAGNEQIPLNICDCKTFGSEWGKVVANGKGQSAASQCSTLSAGRGVLSGCKSIPAQRFQSIVCECKNFGSDWGQVVADVQQAGDLVSQCRTQSHNHGHLENCRVQ